MMPCLTKMMVLTICGRTEKSTRSEKRWIASWTPFAWMTPTMPSAREAHVGKDIEVLVLPEFIEDDEVGPDEQEHVSGVGHAAVERGVLGDLVRYLEFAGGFHGLDHKAAVGEEGGDALGERGLSGAG